MRSHVEMTHVMGFGDPVLESQEAFRNLLTAMAHPGRIVSLRVPSMIPRDLHPASWVVLLTLADDSVRFWTDLPIDHETRWAVQSVCRVRTVSEPQEADLALVVDPSSLVVPLPFQIGTEQEPHLGATILVQVSSLRTAPSSALGYAMLLSGPGIPERSTLFVEGCPKSFWDWRVQLEASYPRGVDLLLVHENNLLALPRSTHVMPMEGTVCTSQ